MKKANILVSNNIELIYDETCPAFNDSLIAYQTVINENGDGEDMLEHIAYSVALWGKNEFIEGIGYVNKPFQSSGTDKEFTGIYCDSVEHFEINIEDIEVLKDEAQ
ncbi:MAG: hypothetical protein KGV56_00235 [Gammaproteobacteria bacterium]|nr:hypothetical protein [Gammaproteobacteria bacterium]